ncbi:MAG: DUF4890 domain-containing protein [Alistipes sp.]|nr:DUF4890 domain-containing protein [Alistipes sp.]
MKALKVLAVAIALTFSGVAMAQAPQAPQQGERPQRQRMTPEQMAKSQTERYAKSLDLSEEQQKKLYDYNLNRMKEQQKQREEMRAQRGQQGQGQRPDFMNMSDADREAFMKQRQEEQKAREAAEDKAMKGILTEAQYKKWQKLKKQQEMRMRQQMQERMQNGGGFGGPGGPGGQGGPGGFGGF